MMALVSETGPWRQGYVRMLLVPLTSSQGRPPTFSYLSFTIALVLSRLSVLFTLYIEKKRVALEWLPCTCT